MSVVSKLNDAVGGVDVVIPESANGLEKGWTTGGRGAFKGRCGVPVYSLSRYGAGTECRSTPGASKAVFEEIYPSGKEAMKQDMTLPLQLYTQITPYMVTDVTADEAVYLAGQALSYSFGDDDFYSMTGTVKMGENSKNFIPMKQHCMSWCWTYFMKRRRIDLHAG